ncbi:MAG: hypothetical protein WCX69_00075 [Candidatus Paceibacterota bacterium]
MEFNYQNIVILALSLVLFLMPVAKAGAAEPTLGELQSQVSQLKNAINQFANIFQRRLAACNAPTGSNLTIVSAESAVKKAVDYVNNNMLTSGTVATFKDVKDENGLYTFKLAVLGKDYPAYVTKNAKLFFADGIPQAIDLDKIVEKAAAADSTVLKSNKPDVKVFVMSYCPYGLQAQKMYLPVYDLLKNKTTMGIYFVNYAMHGKKELDENLRQYCIQKEQGDKMSAYLKCFTVAATAADGTAEFAKCLTSAQIDQTKLTACVAATDKEFKVTAGFNDKSTWVSGQFPKFTVNDDLNTKYGVQGSPTIVINGQEVSIGRSPEEFLKAVCAAFNVSPAECNTKLSADQPSTGFGSGNAVSNASGSCN